MTRLPSKILLDSNVWVDLFAGDRPRRKVAMELVDWAVEHDAALLYAASSAKDVYCILGEREKRRMRAEGVEVTASIASAINEYSWGCLSAMDEIATVVPVDQSDFWLASKYRSIHADFEDDLVLAAAERSGADYLVTGDEVLLRRSPVAALAPCDLLALVKA